MQKHLPMVTAAGTRTEPLPSTHRVPEITLYVYMKIHIRTLYRNILWTWSMKAMDSWTWMHPTVT